MSDYTLLLRLTLRHAYYDGKAVDFEVRPADPRAFGRDGLLLRRDGPAAVVLGPAGASLPADVTLVVLSEGPALLSATEGSAWTAIPRDMIPLERDDWEFGAGNADPLARPIGDQRSIGAATVALAPNTCREVTLRFAAAEAYWAYHVLGGDSEKPLSIVDPDEELSFEDLGGFLLPDGRSTRVLRSATAIPLRARPDKKFRLEQPGNFGRLTLVDVLPAADVRRLKPLPDATAPPRLQADIFITLN